MERIYSKVDPSVLLHTIIRADDINENRLDVSNPEEFLQISVFQIHDGKTFRPHKHIPCEKVMTLPQESWIVISGSVSVFYYELDDTLMGEWVIGARDATVTFRGGHTYKALSDYTRIYEIKNGPYTGQAEDKVFINN